MQHKAAAHCSPAGTRTAEEVAGGAGDGRAAVMAEAADGGRGGGGGGRGARTQGRGVGRGGGRGGRAAPAGKVAARPRERRSRGAAHRLGSQGPDPGFPGWRRREAAMASEGATRGGGGEDPDVSVGGRFVRRRARWKI